MIARVTPYCDDGQTVPNMVGVLVEGEEHERAYVPKRQLVEAEAEVERLRKALHIYRLSELDGEIFAVDYNGEVLD